MKRFFLSILILLFSSSLHAQDEHFNENLLREWHWRLIGPSAPAGRAWKVIGVESDPKILYVTSAGGGLWKSINNGTTFIPIFNNQSTASTGAVAVAHSNPSIVWLGTGEPANTRANSWGDGVYKSTDAGETWNRLGLTDSRMISNIVIHPDNPDIVFVAAMGHLWGRNQERGIFKTTDGGKSWTKSLYVNDVTGFSDIQMDPSNPEVLYAAAWHRFRYGGGDMTESGPESGIYKTTDAGAHWKKLKQGLPTDPMGKIHLAIAYQNTRIVYANILTGEPVGRDKRTSSQGGVFRSEDGGATWTRMNDRQTVYYYDHIYADPSDNNTVWMPVFELNRSTDGGKTFHEVNLAHVHNDLHSMWIDPNDPNHIVLSGDGGVNMTYDGCRTWQQAVLPIGQFYEVSVDNQDPYYVIGGMQDTGHWLGPSRTYDEEGITEHDWIKLRYNGDGMGCATDPRNPNIITMVQEFGNTSVLDLRRWDRRELQPTDTTRLRKKGATHKVRWDWTPAFAQSLHDPDIIYLGSNYLFRINKTSGEWKIISPDLSAQQDRVRTGEKDGYHDYGALFSVAESPLDANILWAGADDGPIWITKNGGKNWMRLDINFPDDVPTSYIVKKIEASRFSKGTAYVAYDGHKHDDVRPYLYKTMDFGKTWTNISSNLPADGPTYVVREDPSNPNVLYAGTEFGVFVTINGGTHWVRLQTNLPTAAVRAMVIQPRETELVVGTFGRAIWITNIAPFGEMSEKTLSKELHLFRPKPATLFKKRVTYGNTIEQLHGDMFFRTENPPEGAVIAYYIQNEAPSMRGGMNAPVGTRIIIKDSDGKTLRVLGGSSSAGVHFVHWDLKPDSALVPEHFQKLGRMTPGEKAYAQKVKPGEYGVTISSGGGEETANLVVRSEGDGVERVIVRK